MKNQQLITGGIIILVGIFLIAITIMKTMIILFYGLAIIGIGIAILLNKKEDVIEKVKKIK